MNPVKNTPATASASVAARESGTQGRLSTRARAPILVVGVSLYQTYTTTSPFEGYMALPTQIYDWISRPQQIFQDSAAAGIVVIMAVLLVANSFAIVLRNRYQKRT